MSPRERAARRLCFVACCTDPACTSAGECRQADVRAHARATAGTIAVLDVIREPSDAAVCAALQACIDLYEKDEIGRCMPDEDGPRPAKITRTAMVAMIDAIKRGEG